MNSLFTEKHIFGGRDGERLEKPLASPKQPGNEVLAVGEEMPPGTRTFAGSLQNLIDGPKEARTGNKAMTWGFTQEMEIGLETGIPIT